ncbi:MAG: hypothetical protein HOP34_11265 [Methylococcaceae bacterium]|nr:hypothetical protein [Methylococcaceae bacterium]
MNKTYFLGLAMAGVLLNPISASAASDSKYPAADFEPSVIYSSNEVAQNDADPKYPAANFTPTVIYVDSQLAEKSQDNFDPKYPAAYFKPTVIYP